MPEHTARACALWCLHTYFLDCFLISPRLAIRSVTHRCGKTTLLDTISHLALRTLSSANVTAASVFRVIEACRPTLLAGIALAPDSEAPLHSRMLAAKELVAIAGAIPQATPSLPAPQPLYEPADGARAPD
jgi:hypothetical protein